MRRDIDSVEFTIFDTETTGLDPFSGDRIIEIAGARVKGNEKLDEFQALVNPERPVSAGAFAVNRISDDLLKGAPGIREVMPKFLQFARGSCLCSYNAAFDMEFLESELRILGQAKPEDFIVIDILRMARRLLPGLERYALWFVAQKLGLRYQQLHRALSDVELSLGVFRKLKEVLFLKGIRDFGNFSSLFSINPEILESLNAQKSAQVQEAISLGAKLKIKYLSSSGAEVTEREVLPKEIRQEHKRSYLVGYCYLRKEERNFRIDGILHLEFV